MLLNPGFVPESNTSVQVSYLKGWEISVCMFEQLLRATAEKTRKKATHKKAANHK